MNRPVASWVLPLVSSLLLLTAPAAHAGPTDGDGERARSHHTSAERSAPGGAASRGAARISPDDSFHVKIDRVRPGTLPRKGTIRLSGTVTNVTDETLTDLNVHPLSSSYPITTSEELAEAAKASPELTFGGVRLTDVGLLDNSIEELAPDEAARWAITLPVDKLRISGGDGVYVLGVQVLATEAGGGRDSIADGRARTFVPRVTSSDTRTSASLVLPVRETVQYAAEGEIADEDLWTRRLDENGRLDNIVDLLENSDSVPVSVALDPAVLDAATQLRDGNPARSIEPTLLPDEGETTDEDGNENEAGDEADSSGSETSEGSVSRLSDVAGAWRNRLVATLGDHSVLALPYGDLEVVGASRWAPAQLDAANAASEQVLSADGIDSRPAVIPPDGLLPARTVAAVPKETAVVLDAAAVSPAAADVVRIGARSAVLAADVSGAADPQDPEGAVGLRQRILSEAAVRALSGDERVLVVNLPGDFNPGRASSSLIRGLDADFINWRSLPSPTDDTPSVERLAYPESAVQREIPAGGFRATQDAVQRAGVLDDVLPLNDAIAETVQRETMTGLSHHAAVEGIDSWQRTTALRQWIDAQLAKITINAPSFVILSSETGPFSMTVSNDLEQPVQFSIQARTTGDLEISAPDSVELAPGTSRTVRMEATSREVGVHEVNLELTSSDGAPLNLGEQVNIRSNSVGKIIWVVLATGLGILAIAVPLRIYRRVRKVRGANA